MIDPSLTLQKFKLFGLEPVETPNYDPNQFDQIVSSYTIISKLLFFVCFRYEE